MRRIALRLSHARSIRPSLILAASLVFAGGTAIAGPALAQDAAGQTEAAQPPTSEDFAAEFNRRFRYDDRMPADTVQLQHRPYDPYFDDEDESGPDQAAGAQSPANDEERDQHEMSGQRSAEPERGEREDEHDGRPGADDAQARAPAGSTGETSRERMSRRSACGERTERRVGRMLDRMERLTQPTGDQQQAFEKLRDAANKAIEIARTACPTERPITPVGRLAAAEKRLETLLEAIRTVRPALDDFYKTLSEEQKAHFYANRRWRDARGDQHARESLGDGRLDAWRDEMRRRWRERWSGEDGWRFHDGGPHHRRYHDDRGWRHGDGWREDGARERWRDEHRDERQSRGHDDEDEDDPVASWNL